LYGCEVSSFSAREKYRVLRRGFGPKVRARREANKLHKGDIILGTPQRTLDG
jgi:hypothetical protein